MEQIIHMYQTPSCRARIYINRPLYQVPLGTRLSSPHAVCAPYKNIHYRGNNLVSCGGVSYLCCSRSNAIHTIGLVGDVLHCLGDCSKKLASCNQMRSRHWKHTTVNRVGLLVGNLDAELLLDCQCLLVSFWVHWICEPPQLPSQPPRCPGCQDRGRW